MKGNDKSALYRSVFSPRMFVAAVMGFSCGLPLLLTITLLQAWMQVEGVDLAVIGLMALVGLPYTLKFMWAPFMDRFTPPFLGRRRGWLLMTQTGLVFAILALGMSRPAHSPWMVAFTAFLVTCFSASQDIVVDAYRREDLTDEELGLGSSLYINGYRVGMLVASGGGLILTDYIAFSTVYGIMAACMLPGMITTLSAREPKVEFGKPTSMRQAVAEPLTEFFARDGAVTILAFIFLYKIGDTMASAMSTPFFLDIGFTKSQIGTVVNLFGFWATVAGGLIGGVMMLKLGINRALWIFGILQAVSTAFFAVLARVGPSIPVLSGVIVFENMSGGMGTAAYAAFMASITNKKFTATQYALLSSLMGIPRVVVSAPTGFLVKQTNWEIYFIICTLIAVPGLLLLRRIAPWSRPGKRSDLHR